MLYAHFGEYLEKGIDSKWKQQEIEQVSKIELKAKNKKNKN